MKDKSKYLANLYSTKTVEFNGYCPESLLWGEQVEMCLNKDDFYESVRTGLQITLFPPYAAILKWRGTGKFRDTPDLASDSVTSLILTRSRNEVKFEILPDEERILDRWFDVEEYICSIYNSKKEYDADKFNPNDEKLSLQRDYLQHMPKEKLSGLVELFQSTCSDPADKFAESFIEKLYDLKLVFDFKWGKWFIGWSNLENNNFSFSNCDLLELSMYFTSICRADKYNEGTINQYRENGTFDKLMKQLEALLSKN